MLSQPSNSLGAFISFERHGLKGRGFYLVKIFWLELLNIRDRVT
jgi:hypothetical protein